MRNRGDPVDTSSAVFDSLTHVLTKTIPDGEQRVRKAVTQYNNIIRDHLRNETGLRLTVGNDQVGVPIRVIAGLPKAFLHATQEITDPLVWKLILNERLLNTTLLGLGFLLDYVAETRRQPVQQDILNEDFSLEGSRDIVMGLLGRIKAIKLRDRLKAINEDVLGAYLYGGPASPAVHLYWMVIAAVSAILDVSIESLTAVVLAHELTHAYTHLGKDIDGHTWRTEDFACTDACIVEGLAQYYGEVVCCGKLTLRFPSAGHAYRLLLEMQSGPYLAHVDWATDSPQRGEAIRGTMIIARSNGMTCAGTFKHRIDQHAAEVVRHSRQ